MALSALAVAKYFARLRDPRRNHRKRHLLIDIIVIALCAVTASGISKDTMKGEEERLHP